MTKQKLRAIIAGLALLNLVTILFFVIKPLITSKSVIGEETAAKVGSVDISRDAWMNELEKRYGKEVLEDMVDEEVVKQAAKKYKVSVSKKELKQELNMLKALYGTSGQSASKSTDQWKEEIRSNLLLEKLLTKDASVSEADMKAYYENNKESYRIPATYHLSHIVTSGESDAKQVLKELEDGASFTVLAMEKSLDEFSANQGGDIGYMSEGNEQAEEGYLSAAKDLKVGQWSEPIHTADGWAVLLLHEKIAGKQYDYGEVKEQIRRQIALEQIQSPVSGKMFWDQFDVEWFYGTKDGL